MFVLSQKLKVVKCELKRWNKLVFCNIHLRVENNLAEVDKLQQEINSIGANDDLLEKETLTQLELQ